MPPAPSTLAQVAILILLVLPGVTYQFMRERFRGPSPAEKEMGERILRALTASIALDTLYVLIGGGPLVELVYSRRTGWFAGATANPRGSAVAALLLFIAVPAGIAWLFSRFENRRRVSVFRATPTSWDYAFRNRGSCFVRSRLKSGIWVGGWYGGNSYASAYPHPADIYLESAWTMTSAGLFASRVEQTAGIYIRLEEVEILEFLQPTTS